MPPQFASLIFASAIAGLFIWDWRLNGKTSSALWIPAVYMFVVASRPVSVWLSGPARISSTDLAGGSPVDAAFYLLLQILAAFVLFRRAQKATAILSRTWPLLAFLAYCLLSLVWSDFPFVALKRWVKIAGDVMMVLVVLTDPYPVTALRRFIAWPGFVLVPLSVLFIKYYPALGRGYDPWTGVQFVHGVSYNKNGLGVICLYWGIGFAWILAETLWSDRRSWLTVTPPAAILCACTWLLLKSSSTTSLVCYLMALVLIICSKLKVTRTRPILIHSMVLVMLLVPTAVLFLGVYTPALEAMGKNATLTDRTFLWEEIFKIRVNPIVGAGYESFWLGDRIERLWRIFWWRPTQAHNGYIEMYINLGIAGLVLLAGLLFHAYRISIASVRRQAVWGGLFLACTVAMIPYNFTEAAYRLQNVPWVFLLLAVVGLPLAAPAVRREHARVRWMVPVALPAGEK